MTTHPSSIRATLDISTGEGGPLPHWVHEEGSTMTLGEVKQLLDHFEKTQGLGPETQVFIADPARGLQDPVFSTSERMVDGAHIVVIETPKDTIDEVS